MTLVAVAVGVFGGAAVTRMTGLGFALVASPLLVLTLGPFNGVLLCNLLSLLVGLAMLATHWRYVQWRRAALLLLPAPLVIPLGGLLVHRLPAAGLSVVIGVLVLIAVALVARGRPMRLLAGGSGAVIAGAAAAGLNVLAGVGGPALALYAVAQRWTGRSLLATLPVCAVVLNGLSLVVKGFPELTSAELVVVIGALVAGSLIGEAFARRSSGQHVQPLLLSLAALGGAASIVKGVLA